jgi:NADPH-dependent curcumin reductase CurA
VEIGAVMPGAGAGRVLESRHPSFAPDDLVHGPLGWQERAVVDGAELAKVPGGVPITAALGVLGSTGKTAYLGLVNVGKPKPGDTLVISGAAAPPARWLDNWASWPGAGWSASPAVPRNAPG